MAPPRKMKIAAAGLGRMGKRHALNFLNRVPRAELVAVFSPDPAELAMAKKEFEPLGVTIYDDYDKMIEHQGLDAVVIGTVTSVHAEEAIKAMKKNLHVLVEKPLSTNVQICQTVLDEAEKHPDLKVMCGFSRRFDDSYRDAYAKIEQGLIGRPCVVRSQTCDKRDRSGWFVQYAAKSGGVFVDMTIHDIDLTLWLLGEDIIPKTISACGIRAVEPDLEQHNDFDNAVGIVEFYNGKFAYYYCSRMMAHGQEDTTEIIGTEGKLSVNINPQSNLVNYYHAGGVTREIPSTYWGRFELAFTKEANEFTDSVLDNTPLPLKLSNAVKAVQIGAWIQEALVSGKQLRFDESGQRIETP